MTRQLPSVSPWPQCLLYLYSKRITLNTEAFDLWHWMIIYTGHPSKATIKDPPSFSAIQARLRSSGPFAWHLCFMPWISFWLCPWSWHRSFYFSEVLVLVPTEKTSIPIFWTSWFQSLHHTKHSDNLSQEASPRNAWKDRLWLHQHLQLRSLCLLLQWCTFCLHWDKKWQPSFFSWFLLVWSTSELSCHKKCDILHQQLALLKPRMRGEKKIWKRLTIFIMPNKKHYETSGYRLAYT